MLPKLELVFVGLTGPDVFLAEACHPIHTRRYEETVPMNAGILWKSVRHINAHTIPLYCFDGWAMDLAVESPTVSAQARREFVINFFSNQVKHFDAPNHFIRERRPVRCNDRSVIFAGLARRVFLANPRRVPNAVPGIF
jgi:hypothetical protein